MPVMYQVVGFGRGDGRQSGRQSDYTTPRL